MEGSNWGEDKDDDEDPCSQYIPGESYNGYTPSNEFPLDQEPKELILGYIKYYYIETTDDNIEQWKTEDGALYERLRNTWQFRDKARRRYWDFWRNKWLEATGDDLYTDGDWIYTFKDSMYVDYLVSLSSDDAVMYQADQIRKRGDGVWSVGCIILDGKVYDYTMPSLAGASGGEDPYANQYPLKYANKYQKEHDEDQIALSKRDAEVETLSQLEEKVGEFVARIDDGSIILPKSLQITITGNWGPCNECKLRIQAFAERVQKMLVNVNLNLIVESRYYIPAELRERGEGHTSYGYYDAEALNDSQGRTFFRSSIDTSADQKSLSNAKARSNPKRKNEEPSTKRVPVQKRKRMRHGTHDNGRHNYHDGTNCKPVDYQDGRSSCDGDSRAEDSHYSDDHYSRDQRHYGQLSATIHKQVGGRDKIISRRGDERRTAYNSRGNHRGYDRYNDDQGKDHSRHDDGKPRDTHGGYHGGGQRGSQSGGARVPFQQQYLPEPLEIPAGGSQVDTHMLTRDQVMQRFNCQPEELKAGREYSNDRCVYRYERETTSLRSRETKYVFSTRRGQPK